MNNHASTGMNPAVGQCCAADLVQNHGSTGASPAVATSNEHVHHPQLTDAPADVLDDHFVVAFPTVHDMKSNLEKYLRVGQLLDLMQAKARLSLQPTRSAS